MRAVRCALRLRRGLDALSREWAAAERPLVRSGIGVHTGYVTVGNIGSRFRLEYTVVGRNVEVAEDLARDAAGKVLVSARTKALTTREVVYEMEQDAPSERFAAVAER